MNWYRNAFAVEDAEIRTKSGPNFLDTSSIWPLYNEAVKLYEDLSVCRERYDQLYNDAVDIVDNEDKKKALLNEAIEFSNDCAYDYKDKILPIINELKKFLNRFKRQARYYKNWDRVKNWELEDVTDLWKMSEFGMGSYIDSIINNIEDSESLGNLLYDTNSILSKFKKLLIYMDENGPDSKEDRPEIVVDFDYRGFRVHNKNHLSKDQVQETLNLLDIVIERLNRVGLGHLVYGDIELFKKLNVLGLYFSTSDLIKLEAGHSGINNSHWVDTLVHEFAHRHWYRFMSADERRGYFEDVYAPYMKTTEGKMVSYFDEDMDKAIEKYPSKDHFYHKDLEIYPILKFIFLSFRRMYHDRGQAVWNHNLIKKIIPNLELYDQNLVDTIIDYCADYFRTRVRKDKLYDYVVSNAGSNKIHQIIDVIIKSLYKKSGGPNLVKSKNYDKFVSVPAVSTYGKTNIREHFAEAVMYLASGKELDEAQKNLLSKWGNINVG